MIPESIIKYNGNAKFAKLHVFITNSAIIGLGRPKRKIEALSDSGLV